MNVEDTIEILAGLRYRLLEEYYESHIEHDSGCSAACDDEYHCKCGVRKERDEIDVLRSLMIDVVSFNAMKDLRTTQTETGEKK